MEQNKREQFIIRRIGGTTYKVRVVFNESGGETMEDKILRIVRNDMVTNDGTSQQSFLKHILQKSVVNVRRPHSTATQEMRRYRG